MKEIVENLQRSYNSVLDRLNRMTPENYSYIISGIRGDISRIESIKSDITAENKKIIEDECEELVKQIREKFDNRIKELKTELDKTKSELEKIDNKRKAAKYQR
jgi:septal ring factor EnvC (AmiA/AmiB activator)